MHLPLTRLKVAISLSTGVPSTVNRPLLGNSPLLEKLSENLGSVIVIVMNGDETLILCSYALPMSTWLICRFYQFAEN
jgi:hypothetical protein